MKLKSKLVISFCIIMFVPIFLSLLFIAAFFRVQWEMVTHNMEVMPDVRGLVFEIALMILLILLLTAGMLMIWIYQSMVTPIKKLQIAAENIKEGNLDFSIDTVGAEQDEMNELCVTFEEMRRRLKESAEEKIAAEQNLEASEEAIEEQYKNMAVAYQTDVEKLKELIKAEYVAKDCLVETAMDYVKSKAVIVEKAAE